MKMVDAQQARRALDYLVGFTLSPVLWRKLPGSRSAGRVQSVALRLICERETEIEAFNPQEYWSVKAAFDTGAGVMVDANLTVLDSDKLAKYDLKNEADATRAKRAIGMRGRFRWPALKRNNRGATRRRRSPRPPCNRKRRASCTSRPVKPCRWRRNCMKASTSAAKPWV